MNPARTPDRNGSRARVNGKAAAVPTMVASSVTWAEMLMLVFAACWIW